MKLGETSKITIGDLFNQKKAAVFLQKSFETGFKDFEKKLGLTSEEMKDFDQE